VSLDSVINAIIGPAIFLALAILIYSKAKTPINNFFAWVSEKIKGRGEKDDAYEGSYNIDYQPVGTYDYNEEI